jgi:hypothetical protein
MLATRGIQYTGADARTTFINCSEKRQWLCTTCAHPWDATCNNVCGNKKRGCPICAGRELCDKPDCVDCHVKSVASLSVMLATRGIQYTGADARTTFINCSEKRQWLCTTCSHPWDATCASVCGNPQSGCPTCAGREMCDKPTCSSCYNKSVASQLPQLAARGIQYAGTDARTTFINCREKRKWLCTTCRHRWGASCYSVCGVAQSGCPRCKHKGEKAVTTFVEARYSVRQALTFAWCGHKRFLPFDVIAQLDGKLVIVEIDGRAHFEHVHHWRSDPAEVRRKDVFKMWCALTHGLAADGVVGVVRIPQMDVLNDAWPVWRMRLEAAIQQLCALPADAPAAARVLYVASVPACYDAHVAELAAALAARVPPSYSLEAAADGEDGDDEDDGDGAGLGKRKRDQC